MTKQINSIIKTLSLEEKIALLAGENDWETRGIPGMIPSVKMADSTNGLRIELTKEAWKASTCYPAMVSVASSWNKAVVAQLGHAIADECIHEGIDLILGPGVNIKRSPLCGRNFEYLSEDPYLTAELATAYIEAVQKEGVGTALKHFVCNNQEVDRMTLDVRVSERALHEIYLKAFEKPVRVGKPWTVMSSYNRVNGSYMSEHKELLVDVLRDKWGFDGLVMSDWNGVNHRGMGVEAQMNLEMPFSHGKFDHQIHEALDQGVIKEADIDSSVGKLIELSMKCKATKKQAKNYDLVTQHQLAYEIGAECAVLLKNSGKILPLKKDDRLVVIGEFATNPRYQGGGSANINPSRMDIPLDFIKKTFENVGYYQGYDLEKHTLIDEEMEDLKNAVLKADKVVCFLGLPESFESEYFDREDLKLPTCQNQLMAQLTMLNKNIVVVLNNGSAIEMPWIEDVKGVLEGHLLGQACGSIITDILSGVINPSGKLAETFPVRLEDTPSYLSYPGVYPTVIYKEDIFVGYRYYDKKVITPLFEFGYGLSYTDFRLFDCQVETHELSEGLVSKATICVENTGNMIGAEVVQLYVGHSDAMMTRAPKELKRFEKVRLLPGESKAVTFELNRGDFSYYDEGSKAFMTKRGQYKIYIGTSSRDITFETTVDIASNEEAVLNISKIITINELINHSRTQVLGEKILAMIYDELEHQTSYKAEKYNRFNQSLLKSYPIRNMEDLVSKELAKVITDMVCNIEI